jgi:3'5'-cyclic nucleotide phosphodiesterase
VRAPGGRRSSQSGGERESREFKEASVTEKDRTASLVDWHVDLLLGVLQNKKNHNVDGMKQPAFVLADTDSTKMPRDEVADLIVPENLTSGTSEKTETVEITPLVQEQLRELVERIAQKYTTTNAFHTFAHCSHVVLSAKKLLDNLVVAEDAITSTRHSFVMAKHPLTQFAILFAALIHDVDHPGVSNAQQVQEQTVAAVRFAGQSVAEQHSFTMAWSMLMEPQYIDLHKVLFSNKDDLELFRQVVVNAVMATDLFDANLKQVREERWQLSRWSDPATTDKNNDDDASLASSRASCLVDFIVQLSDVAHTMQHFTIYKKWNLRHFDEMSTSYYNGRAGDRNPAVTWYDGEIAFLDNYVVMFGVLGDEFLAYVQDNRVEWQAKGRDIVLQAFTSHTKKDDGLIEV